MNLYFCGQRPPQLVVPEDNNIFEVTETHIRGRRPPYFLVAGGHKTFEVTCPDKNRDYGHYKHARSKLLPITRNYICNKLTPWIQMIYILDKLGLLKLSIEIFLEMYLLNTNPYYFLINK